MTECPKLNPHQQRRLKVTCEHIDRLLSDVEAILHAAESRSPFPRYAPDISVRQRRALESYIAQMRSFMVRVLERQGISIDPPSIPASHAVHSNITFIDISIEELRPRYMRGYGEVQPEAAAELNHIVDALQSLVKKLDATVTSG